MCGMSEVELTPHGKLLDQARREEQLTQREAARLAKISEGRWRQIVTGVQRQGGVAIPVNPKPSTLASMARAVKADPAEVLHAAGFEEAEVSETATPPLPAGVRPIGDPGDELVEFRVSGAFGVQAVVRGPIRDIDALQAAVSNLIAGMRTEDVTESM